MDKSRACFVHRQGNTEILMATHEALPHCLRDEGEAQEDSRERHLDATILVLRGASSIVLGVAASVEGAHRHQDENRN